MTTTSSGALSESAFAESAFAEEDSKRSDAWLVMAAAPGRSALRRAGVMLSIGTLFAAAEWFALSAAAGAVVGHGYGVIGLCVAGMAIAGMLAALAMWAARRAQTEGRGAIARGIRASLAAAMMPSGRRSAAPEPARAAHALVELTDDVADYHSTAGPLRVAAPIAMILILGLTAWVHWPAAIVLVLSTALVPLNMRLAGLFAQDGTDRHLVAMRRLSAMALDSFRGLHTLVNLGAVNRRRGDIDRASRALNSETMTVLRRAFLSGLIMDVVVTFSIAANATYIGLALLRYVTVPGVAPISLTSGLFVLMLCPMYFAPLRTMASAFHDRERATSAARAITSLLAAEPDSSIITAPVVTPAGPIGVTLTGVLYRAPDDDADLFAIDALHAEAGQWTAVTGVSGAGKTTLLSLIAGLREPGEGAILWHSDRGIVAPTAGGAAWIGQQTVILEDTILENVRLGRPDASDADIAAAVDAAGLGPAVGKLQHGLASRIGDGGWGLSTGEARRVAIARALLSGAGLWILDEPTAHLDPDSEQSVLRALLDAARGKTVIVATHSPTVVRSAVAVWNIDDRVVQDLVERAAA